MAVEVWGCVGGGATGVAQRRDATPLSTEMRRRSAQRCDAAQRRDATPPSAEMRRRSAQRCDAAQHSASVPPAGSRARYTGFA